MIDQKNELIKDKNRLSWCRFKKIQNDNIYKKIQMLKLVIKLIIM